VSLRLRPWTVKAALPFVRRVHRRLPRVQGALWVVSVREGSDVVGCALVGHPARTLAADHETLAVLRVAVIGAEDPDDPPRYPNACSMLYGACSRAVRAMGADNLVTYTHGDEHGTSLRAAGWIDGGLTNGGEHSRQMRLRLPAADPLPKRRWWAPWSLRAKELAQ